MTDPAFAVTVMPDSDEILRRLLTVDDMPHMVQGLYPPLLRLADQEKTGMGVVTALHLAVADYTVEMPGFVAQVVLMRLEAFTRALLDPGPVLDDALANLGQLGLLARTQPTRQPSTERHHP